MLFNTVEGYSEHAAAKFLQTAVFIDDRIYERDSGSIAEPQTLSTPKQRKSATKSAEENKDSSNIKVTDQKNDSDFKEYSPHDIVDSFAQKQIICALYQPKNIKNSESESEILSLCIPADIVVIDWDMYGDRGVRALSIANNLVKQAVKDVPEQLRLILIYTQELDLFDIANQLFEKVNESVGNDIEPQLEDQGLAFHTLNSRVVILGKKGRDRNGQYKNHEVSESELADRTIKEFAKLASGLLHATVLLGLANIKENSRKILSKFNAMLDPAFLAHRAFSLPNEDASEHLIPLLVSEIESVLEDALPHPLITDEIISDWCDTTWKQEEDRESSTKDEASESDLRELIKIFCLEGEKSREIVTNDKKFSKISNLIPKKLKSSDQIKQAANLLSGVENKLSHYEFSRLMSSRTFYERGQKSLKLGVIVRLEQRTLESKIETERTPKYLLCLQPVCDSVRLDESKKHTFIFIELENTNQTNSDKTSHILISKEGEIIELLYKPKSFNCYIAEFSPTPESKNQIITETLRDGRQIFQDENQNEYTWLDQLKTSHAQRAAEKFARELSRVGLTESEWLRRLS